ncbi:MAG: MBL fold metallo-hydrolase [Deltaproteobacteria bacterium]|nr:MBL fold metallo-hydrolase [Deltaproteobacteria bacterium]
MKQATANVYVEDQFSVPPNCRGSNWGYLVTSDGVVMLDTPMVPRTAVERRGEIARRGEVRYIINTHHHVDHVTGNFFFPGPVVSHESVREAFLAPLASVSGSERVDEAVKIGQGTIGYIRLLVGEHDPESLPLLDSEKYRIKMPSITFSERLRLHVGNHTIEAIHLPGHTEGHIGVYIPQERIFFAGDNFCNGTQPSLAHCLPLEWVASLKRIESMEIDVVVPGHGEMSGLKEVAAFRRFIETCIEMTRAAIREGKSKEQAAETLSFEKLYPSDRCRMAVHPGSAMQRRNVSRLYEKLSERK